MTSNNYVKLIETIEGSEMIVVMKQGRITIETKDNTKVVIEFASNGKPEETKTVVNSSTLSYLLRIVNLPIIVKSVDFVKDFVNHYIYKN